jgi:hypothetical protein
VSWAETERAMVYRPSRKATAAWLAWAQRPLGRLARRGWSAARSDARAASARARPWRGMAGNEPSVAETRSRLHGWTHGGTTHRPGKVDTAAVHRSETMMRGGRPHQWRRCFSLDERHAAADNGLGSCGRRDMGHRTWRETRRG